MATLILYVRLFISVSAGYKSKLNNTICLWSGKAMILHNHSFWMMFLCIAILETAPGQILLLRVDALCAQTAVPNVTWSAARSDTSFSWWCILLVF